MEVGDQRQATTALLPKKRTGTHRTGGWVWSRVYLDGCGKSRPHRGSIPGPSHLHLYVVITRRSL